MEKLEADTHQDVIITSSSDDINEVEEVIHSIMYAVEDFLFDTTKHIKSSFSLVSPMPEPEGPSTTSYQNYHHATVLLTVFVV